jgi:hypothetical protein
MKRLFLGILGWFCLWLPANPQSSVAAKPLEGVWLADGYGLLVEFDAAGLRTYELTSISYSLTDRKTGGEPSFGFGFHVRIRSIDDDRKPHQGPRHPAIAYGWRCLGYRSSSRFHAA